MNIFLIQTRRFLKKTIFALLWLLFGLFPIRQKKIVAQSFDGRGFSDNPKAIVEELLARRKGYKIIWPVKSRHTLTGAPSSVKVVRLNSLEYFYHIRTAKLWIDNCRKGPYISKRKQQIYIQTWHGSIAFKRAERDAESTLSKEYVISAKNDSKMIDIIISNNASLTTFLKNSFWYSGEVLECGSPKNDVLFRESQKLKTSVISGLGIKPGIKTLLYAPTFRKDEGLSSYNLDYDAILDSLRDRFGGNWIVLVRLHPNMAEQSKGLILGNDHRVIDVSNYPDVQDLIIASDVLVTDYSSLMFDFMLTKKPCFIYAHDIDEYKNDRGLYFSLDMLPFDVAGNNLEMQGMIKCFDKNKYVRDVNKFIKTFQIVDEGHASKDAVDWALDHMGKA